MEFFDWMGIPQFFLEFFNVSCSTSQEVVDALTLELLICIGVAAGLFLLGHILGGIGLYTMAKREGVSHPLLAFLPVGCTYLAGKLAGEASFFGQKMKRAGLYAALSEIVYILFNTFVLVLNFLTLDADFYIRSGEAWKLNPGGMDSLSWVCDALTYCNVLVYLPWLFVVVFFFVLYTAFFRKYYARNPFLMSFLCVFLPVRGFVLFAVRNNRPVDYQEYMRRRMEEYARRNPTYRGPYGPDGPYSPGGGSSAEPDPFSDFGGTGNSSGDSGGQSGGKDPDDPFSDF